MAKITSVNAQSNPLNKDAGKRATEAVAINTDQTSGNVTYNIRKRDGSDSISIDANSTTASSPRPNVKIISVSAAKLEVELDFRTRYKVRINRNGTWTGYTNFKTRDKTYTTPDAITQLTDDGEDSPNFTANRTLNITNSAKSTVTKDNGGNVTITNSDKGGNGITGNVETARGATITNTN